MPLSGVLIGHSFVSGLYDHLCHKTKRCLHTTDLPKQFRVDDRIPHFHMIGQRGLTVAAANIPLSLAHIHPDFVIIDAGTNDLAAGAAPLSVATTLIDIASTLLQQGVKHVTICSILYRNNNMQMTPDHFQHQTNMFNTILKDLCEVQPAITYHTHKGFWTTPITIWSHGSIHSNTQTGRQKYITSIRASIYNTLRTIS